VVSIFVKALIIIILLNFDSLILSVKMIMKPMPGMTGGYSRLNSKDPSIVECCLRVQVISYEENESFEKIWLKVIKILERTSWCEYEEGNEFSYTRKKGGDEEDNPLESLILDSV